MNDSVNFWFANVNSCAAVVWHLSDLKNVIVHQKANFGFPRAGDLQHEVWVDSLPFTYFAF